jgi:hypothetical protein
MKNKKKMHAVFVFLEFQKNDRDFRDYWCTNGFEYTQKTVNSLIYKV